MKLILVLSISLYLAGSLFSLITLTSEQDLYEAINTKTQDLTAVSTILKNSNLDINWKTHSGATALMTASFYGHVEIVKLLLAAKANINATDHNGITALMWACFTGNIEIVKLLLAAGADTNIEYKTFFGNGTETALSLAQQCGHLAIVKIINSYSGN